LAEVSVHLQAPVAFTRLKLRWYSLHKSLCLSGKLEESLLFDFIFEYFNGFLTYDFAVYLKQYSELFFSEIPCIKLHQIDFTA
jgi:hypothetical protein